MWCEQLWPALTAPPGLQVLSQGRCVEAEVLHTWGQFFGLFVTVGAAAHLVVGATFMLRGGPGAGHHGEETESDGRRDREDGGHDA
ncbi:hypothetical protein GCM10018782_65770 [Streptomyces griseoaurantiacus]|nr:hypothetical protein GCM10018782_65770 [Streptomyces griseoaurantiacus]